MKLYEVGGRVRDHLLGIESNDIDIAVEAGSWDEMLEFVRSTTKKIFLIKPEFLTIRAQDHDGKTKDFVLCRKDGAYSDSRHPDTVEPGTILDDTLRRDFSINAMALDLQTGEILDFHGGRKDLDSRIIRCVGTAEDRFNEDALRIIRAIRFTITKDFHLHHTIANIILDKSWAPKIKLISRERVREEIAKCFKHDTLKAIHFLSRMVHQDILKEIFQEDIWVKPTMESR